MRAATLGRSAVRSILRHKMRTLLTMLGIIIGVGAVIVMVAIGEGARAQIEAQISSLGTNLIIVTPGSTQPGGVSQGAGSFNRLTLDDVEKLREQCFLVSALSPVIVTRTQVVGGEGNWRASIYGVSTDYAVIREWATAEGGFFDAADERTMRKVAVLGKTVATNLFPEGDPVGRQIRLRNVPFQVVGVLAEKGQTAEGIDQDDVVIAPYTTVNTRLAGRQFIGQILASTFSPSEIPAAQEEVRAVMREAHKLADWEEDDFTIRNQDDLAEAAQTTTDVMTNLLFAIASVSLIVGGIGIMNIMLVSVTERTREIGIRMSVGARGSDVLLQFLVESVVLCLVGGVLGVGAGVLATDLVGRGTGWATAVQPESVFLALGFAGAVGVFFGFYPARKAAALDPIAALRYE
ncbi:MAG: ABC transporter permease [Candidatus Eiseniibacteriota bacterium]